MNLQKTRAPAFVYSAPPKLASHGARPLWAFVCGGGRINEKVSRECKRRFIFGGVPASASQLLSMLAFNVILMSASCTRARGEAPSPPVLHRCPRFFELLAYSQMPDLRKYGIQPARMIGAGDLWPKGSARDAVRAPAKLAHGQIGRA